MSENLMDKIVSLCKRRGFIFPSSEIYGGFGSCYDYGPLGVELKNNIKKAWWKNMVQDRTDVVGLDSSILMSPKVWEASGHLTAGFADLLVECKRCHKRFKEDDLESLKEHVLEEYEKSFEKEKLKEEASERIKSRKDYQPGIIDMADNLKIYGDRPKLEKALKEFDKAEDILDKVYTKPKKFNLMMQTFVGPVEDEASKTYLRAETCQGIYVNFENVQKSMRMKIPFGIAQVGKAFRNEITPGNFIYRMREFEQMEMQYFTNPKQIKNELQTKSTEERNVDEWFEYWKGERMKWYENLGIKKESLRFRNHEKDELAHYAKAACDIEYKFPFNWSEIEGIHNRGDWDLSSHSKYSGKDMSYFNEETKEKFIPHIIETSAGADRSALVFIIDAYKEEKVKGEKRVVLKLNKDLAPIKIAVLPLVKNKKEITEKAKEVFDKIKTSFMSQYDEVGSIGRRYRRQDEAGTPYCLTIDFDSLKDNAVTVRDRDSMKQERVKISKILEVLEDRLD